ncbi:conserved hypothetical secreted protein [Mycobacterium marinum E11]|nr:conserved hypothetical secreted protein [Mycobacterium marinum E11]
MSEPVQGPRRSKGNLATVGRICRNPHRITTFDLKIRGPAFRGRSGGGMRRSKHHNLIPAIKSFRSSTLPETQEPLENVLNFRKQLAHKLKGFCMVRLDNFMIGVILPIAGLFGAAMPFIAGGPDVAPVDPAPDPVAAAPGVVPGPSGPLPGPLPAGIASIPIIVPLPAGPEPDGVPSK